MTNVIQFLINYSNFVALKRTKGHFQLYKGIIIKKKTKNPSNLGVAPHPRIFEILWQPVKVRQARLECRGERGGSSYGADTCSKSALGQVSAHVFSEK